MNNGNVKPKRNLRSIFVALALVVIVSMTCIVPAFAANTHGGNFVLNVGSSFSGNYDAGYFYLYLDEETPLTVRYLEENPDFYLKFDDGVSNYDYDLSVGIGLNTSVVTWSQREIEPSQFSKYFSDGASYNESLYDMPISVLVQSSSKVTFTVSELILPPPPNPFQDLMNCVPIIFGAWLSVATSVMAWVISEPLAIIGAISCLIVAGVFLSKRLTRC